MAEQWIPQEFIVVEGRDDTRRLVEVFGPEVKTIETGGSAIDDSVLDEIDRALEQSGVIVLTDPDYPGERIRTMIRQAYPTVKHAHLSQRQSASHRKHQSLGVEHASGESIREALAQVMTPIEINSQQVTYIPLAQLIAFGLVASSSAQRRRDYISNYFRIGRMNGKQLQKQLARYQITLEKLQQALEEGEHLGRI